MKRVKNKVHVHNIFNEKATFTVSFLFRKIIHNKRDLESITSRAKSTFPLEGNCPIHRNGAAIVKKCSIACYPSMRIWQQLLTFHFFLSTGYYFTFLVPRSSSSSHHQFQTLFFHWLSHMDALIHKTVICIFIAFVQFLLEIH